MINSKTKTFHELIRAAVVHASGLAVCLPATAINFTHIPMAIGPGTLESLDLKGINKLLVSFS